VPRPGWPARHHPGGTCPKNQPPCVQNKACCSNGSQRLCGSTVTQMRYMPTMCMQIYVLLEGGSASQLLRGRLSWGQQRPLHTHFFATPSIFPNLATALPTNLRVGRHTATALGCHRQPKNLLACLVEAHAGSATVMTVEIKRCFF
jgi:hypothetical protein